MNAFNAKHLLVLVLWPALAPAATCTWTGASSVNSNWSTVANWDSCGGLHAPPPADGDIVVFPNSAARKGGGNNDLSGLDLLQLQFTGLNYDISGNAITLSVGVTSDVPIGMGGDLGPIFRPAITLVANPQTFQCNGSRGVSIRGALNLNGLGLTLSGDGCPNILDGVVSGGGGLVKSGTGLSFLTGTNTYTGTTTVNGGTLEVRNGAGLGATGAGNGTTVNNGATLSLGFTIATSDALTLSGTGVGGLGALQNSIGNNIASGAIALASNASVGVLNAGSNHTLTVSGPISGSAGLTKVGPGTLVLSGGNIYTGTTTINGGILQVNSAIASAVINGGGRLQGTGAVGAIALNAGGTLAPGGTPGTLNTSTLTWNGGGEVAFELGASSSVSDRLLMSGSLSKGSGSGFLVRFSDAASSPVAGVTYVLIEYPSTTFVDADFSHTYNGVVPANSMSGGFIVTPTQLEFVPTRVSLFRDNFE